MKNEKQGPGSARSRPNSLDIAMRAGVSQATVSRALRGSQLVNQATRERIVAIARELNYKVDKSASNLRTQRSNTLALLLFEDATGDQSLINPFFLSLLASITRAAAAANQDLLVSFQQLSDDWQADYENSHKADGLILLGYGNYVEYRSKLERLTAGGAHFVRWGAARADQPGLAIGCDNTGGGELVTSHLIARGRKRIAFIGEASSRYPEFNDRNRGYRKALERAGLEVDPNLQVDAITTERSGYQAISELLRRGAPFDAIFAASDLIAIGAIQALFDQGYTVPEQVSVAGFDDIPMARYCRPALTTLRQDTVQAGQVLVQSLLKLIAGQTLRSHTIPGSLIVRGSCGAAVESVTET
jgi:DNA-binding LacI/PurR family transcriptional regulator